MHAFSGYMLMLATMTFSCEMMLAVIVGLMIDYCSFGRVTVISANTCCAFLEEESGASEPSLEPLHPRNEESCCQVPTSGNHRSQEIAAIAPGIP